MKLRRVGWGLCVLMLAAVALRLLVACANQEAREDSSRPITVVRPGIEVPPGGTYLDSAPSAPLTPDSGLLDDVAKNSGGAFPSDVSGSKTRGQSQESTGRLGGKRGGFPDGADRYGDEFVARDSRPIEVARADPREEIWVITKPGPQARPAPDDKQLGCGAMIATVEHGRVPVPLKHTDVKASITGYIAAVDVTQQFQNPYDSKIEAIYVFPLPHNAAIHEFVMTLGNRKIRGIIREKEEAEQVYAQAKAQGLAASLMTQQRPNIFTQKVANIEPGKQIDVNITYYHTLAYDDGWYEWVFPMVVGPRYNPAGTQNPITPVPNGTPGAGQKTQVAYLKPNERSGHDISLAVNINAGVPIEEVSCVSHQTHRKNFRDESGSTTITLASSDALPNKDFVLRYRVAGEKIKSSLVTHKDDRGGFFTLMLFPPKDLKGLSREPVEMVFLLDVSGSMSGQPWAKVRDAVGVAMRKIDSKDSFQIVTFAGSASALTESPVRATPDTRAMAMAHLQQMREGGGTEMLKGFALAINRAEDTGKRRIVSLMTDGFIGNEANVIGLVDKSRQNTRFFAFGVGSSPNRYLIDGVAKAGAGAAAYVGLQDDAEEVMTQYFDRVSHPALTDIVIDWGGMSVSDVYPKRLPDLYVGRPVILTGRFTGKATRAIRVTGKAGENEIAFNVSSKETDTPRDEFSATRALPSIWARGKIADLADMAGVSDPRGELRAAVKRVAIDFGLMSEFTAFVAVDAGRRTEGSHGTTVSVPVPVPEGTRYETTVGER